MRWTSLVVAALLSMAACRSAAPHEEAPQSLSGEPLPSGYEIVFEGNDSLKASRLRKAIDESITEFEASGYRSAYVDDAAFDVEEVYHDSGFPFCSVDYTIDEGETVTVVFHVDEGPRTLVGTVTFEGNAAVGFGDTALLAFFNWERTGLLGQGDLLYIEGRVRAAARSIEGAYVGRGYLDARVAQPTTSFNGDRTLADIDLVVTEGPLYRLRILPTVWGTAPDRDLYTRCERTLLDDLVQDTRYYPELPYSIRAKLVDVLHRAGYPNARVEFERKIEREEAGVAVQFSIDPGPQVTIDRVLFGSELTTRGGFLRSRMKVESGDRFDSALVRESVVRLYETGLFKSVKIDLADPPEGGDPSRRDLAVELEESKSLDVFVEPGWGSYELARVRFGARERNLLGTGRQLSAEATAAVRAQRMQVDLVDPWFLKTEYIGRLSLDFDRRENPSYTGVNLGAGAFIEKRWVRSPDISTTVGYEYRRSTAQNIKVDLGGDLPPDLQEALNTVNISNVRIDHRYDSRDNFFAATRGYFGEASIAVGDEAIGSELDFARGRVTLQNYRALSESRATVLAMALRLAVIIPTSKDEFIPIQERLFNGGENTVRSFRQDQLGPKSLNDEPIGGEGSSVASIELRRRWGQWIGTMFFDAGHVALEATDYLDFEHAGTGVGVGVGYMTPIGPLRVDFAMNPNPDPTDAEFVVHFALGLAF